MYFCKVFVRRGAVITLLIIFDSQFPVGFNRIEGVDYNLEDLTWLWHVTILDDEEIIVNNQKGVDSKFYKPGRLSEMEYFPQHFLNWYLKAIS